VSSSRRSTGGASGSKGKRPRAAERARKTGPKSAAPARATSAKPVSTPPGPPRRPESRLGASPASRITIKPGPPPGQRPPLELSTKPRPGGPRPLSDVALDEDEVLIDGFEAILQGSRVRITAVLERTCVYLDQNGERRLARKDDLVVEADKLPIRRRGLG
jgi:hypothetical protein